jgi:hypothetical protein
VTGTTKFAQLDPGDKVWSRVTMTLADPASTPLATIYVFNRDLGAFRAGTEYWYVNPQSLSMLGRYALEISATSEANDVVPPDPYYPREQSFTQPQFVSWGDGWSRDPGASRGGTLYTGPDGMSLRLNASRTGLLDITWSQVIPAKATARNILPTGKFTSDQESVTVPAGYLGYSIHQSTN